MQTTLTLDYDTPLNSPALPDDVCVLLKRLITGHTTTIGDFLGRSEDVLIHHCRYRFTELEWLYQRFEEHGLTREGARDLQFGYGKRQQRRAAERQAEEARETARLDAFAARMDAQTAAMDED